MIYFDVTQSQRAAHKSGLTRVSDRLRRALGAAATPVAWASWNRVAAADDLFLTAELFAPEDRPGIREFLANGPCRCAAIYHDAIPLKWPHITWPRSVARHPGYLKLLAEFGRIWANSEASRGELLGYWRWLGVNSPPPVEVLALGADFDGAPRSRAPSPAEVPVGGTKEGSPLDPTPEPPRLLCPGILEPRKNQSFLLDICSELWDEGLSFGLDIVGRANPHFGRPILAKIKAAAKRHRGLRHCGAVGDAELARLYDGARATIFPTLAEGSGLPLLESLWRGTPCLASDLPSLRENAAAGGCVLAPPGERNVWKRELAAMLTDEGLCSRLAREARSRPLPTWEDAGRALLRQAG